MFNYDNETATLTIGATSTGGSSYLSRVLKAYELMLTNPYHLPLTVEIGDGDYQEKVHKKVVDEIALASRVCRFYPLNINVVKV